MVLLIILTIASIAVPIIIGVQEQDGVIGFLSWIIGACFWALAFVIIAVISCCLPNSVQNLELKQIEQITALKDNAGVSGRYYLGSGYSKSEPYYFYVSKTSQGYIQKSIKAEEAYIVYTSEDYRVEEYNAASFKNWYTWIYAVPAARQYKIYLPKGSIKTDYVIDLE